MSVDYKSRQAALAQVRKARGVDAVAIVPGANMVYFTGLHLHLSERPAIAFFSDDGLSIILPKLEMPKVSERPDLEARVFMWDDTEGYIGAFQQAVDALGLGSKTLGIDGMTMRATEMLAFKQLAPDLQIETVERDLTHIRSRKQRDEVESMRRAVQIAEAALGEVIKWVQPGMTERQIARKLDEAMMNNGAEALAFESLVQTGPNSATPHGFVTDRVLQAGEFLLIDFGCMMHGYPSDITRTFCIGEPTEEMQKIYDTVARANEAARQVVKPGIAMSEVDRAARDVIEAAGYGQYFTHRTGHGLGLDPHEPIPQIAQGVADLLEPGMAFTIEPGIYIPELGGVRIEDNVVVTETGVDVLTSYPRTLKV